MLDISTMPVDVLIEITKQWLSRFGDCNKPIPIVAIAHTKNFTEASERNMLEFFTWLNNEQLTFSTYGQWLESLKESGKK